MGDGEKRKINFFLPIVAVVVVVVLFVLIGVNKAEKVPTPEAVNEMLSGPFTASANIRFGELHATADIGKSGESEMNFVISEPAVLKGLEFAFSGDKVTARYKGLELKLDDDSLIARSAAAIAVNAINTAAKDSGVSVALDGDAILVKGENSDGKFVLALDKKTGALLRLNVPGIDFECAFNGKVAA